MTPPTLVLSVGLVPKPLWGKSLAQLLPRHVWRQVREHVLAISSHRCVVCRSTGNLVGDEVWAYDDATHVARLVSVRALCRMCHHVKHLGRSGRVLSQEEMDRVIQHALAVNECDRHTFATHVRQAGDVWKRRNKRRWTIDWGEYTHLLGSTND